MTISKNAKHKEYARYAEHCLHMVTVAQDQDARAIQREMAAEWLELADSVLLGPTRALLRDKSE
jgi:hypothetical protein